MQKKIHKYMFVSSILAVFLTLLIFMVVLYSHFVNMEIDNQKTKLNMIKKSYLLDGINYLQNLENINDRITVISKNGTVIFDSEVDKSKMENHLKRKEVQGASENGFASSIRFSNTKYEYHLYSAIKLDSGTIIRLSKPIIILINMLIELFKSLVIIVIIVILFSIFYSKKLYFL